MSDSRLQQGLQQQLRQGQASAHPQGHGELAELTLLLFEIMPSAEKSKIVKIIEESVFLSFNSYPSFTLCTFRRNKLRDIHLR